MKSNYKRLGNYIRPVDERNKDLAIDRLLGVSISKTFIESIANTVGTDFSNYKVVKRNQFAYGPVTSRNGDKISVALLNEGKCIISSSYSVFEVNDENQLSPDYLMLWFNRPEFDRYARYMSHGSVREIFSWDDMCDVELPVPSIDEQHEIVAAYKAIENRITLKKKINDNLVDSLCAIYREKFTHSEYPSLTMKELCSKIGSGATPKGGKESYHSTGISLIRSTNVFDYVFSYTELAHIDDAQANALSNVVIQNDDVLFNITGVSVARCCMVPSDILPARVNQHVMILRPYAGKYMSYYIMFTLCNSDYKSKLLGIGQSGSTREAINKQEMEAFQIPVPNQNEIESFGEMAEKLYDKIHNNNMEISALCELKNVLLAKLSGH